MRVLIYSANFAPEPTGIGKYSGEMASWLADRGHQVRVVAAPPYYPAWKVDPKYRWRPFCREQWRGVDVWRAPLWVPKSPSGLTRILHLISFAISSFPVMLWQIFWQPDLVLTVAPAFMCAPTGLVVARLSRAKAYLHIQDFEVDVAFNMGLLKGKLLQRIVLRMESWVLRRFDAVSTISGRMVERLLSKGVRQKDARYFPNWVDLGRIRPSVNPAYRTQLGIGAASTVVLFSGTLGGKQGLAVIPAAARLLAERPDILFVICGDGVMKPALQEAAADLSNVIFMPLQPLGRLADLLGMADIHLLPQSPDAADLVLPSKLSGMLASGRPVVATCQSGTEIAEIVSQCGLVVAPEDSQELARAVVGLADHKDFRLDLGRRARSLAEARFGRDAVLGEMFNSLTETEGTPVTTDIPA